MGIGTHILSFVAGALLLAGLGSATPVHSSMHQHSADGSAHSMMVCEDPCEGDALATFDCLAYCLKAATEGREGVTPLAPVMPASLAADGVTVDAAPPTHAREVSTRFFPLSQGFEHLSLQRRE